MAQGNWKSALRYSARTSRRSFLRAAAGTAAMASSSAWATPGLPKPGPRRVLALVGTYSSPQGPEGSKGRGQGIYVLEMNPASGALSQREVIPNDANPACLALTPSRAHLFCANEVSNYGGGSSGSVSGYTVDRATGHLALINTVSSEGAGPAHLSVHPSGKYVLVANYAGGSVAVLPIHDSGELGAAATVIHDQGVVSPEQPHSAPKGSLPSAAMTNRTRT